MQRLRDKLLTTSRVDGTKEICGLCQSLVSMGCTREARDVCNLLIETCPGRRHVTPLADDVIAKLEALCLEIASSIEQKTNSAAK